MTRRTLRTRKKNSPSSPARPGNFVAPMPCIVYTTKQEKGGGTRELHPDAQRHPVVEIALDDGGTKITRVGELYHREDLPVGVPITWDKADRAALNAWWTNRFIPSARSGLVDALSQLGFPDPQQVISRNLGLSLSDHYWVKPASSNLSWNEVNFFENGFSPDVGDALLGKLSKSSGIDLRSPDWTCDGNLRKRWAILDGKRCLVKAAAAPSSSSPSTR